VPTLDLRRVGSERERTKSQVRRRYRKVLARADDTADRGVTADANYEVVSGAY
jgi:hypothetical protein